MSLEADQKSNREPKASGQRLLSVCQAAQYLGISRHTLYSWVSQRRIPYVKVGRRTMFDREALDGWIEERTVEPLDFLNRDLVRV